MDTIVENIKPIQNKQLSDDQEGQQLFDQISMSQGNPFENLQLSSEIKHSHQDKPESNQENQQEVGDFRQMMKKSKKDKKKLKKKNKIQIAKNKKQNKKENIDSNVPFYKKLHKKMVLGSEDEDDEQPKQNSSPKMNRISKQSQEENRQSQEDSAEYSSEQNLSQSQNKKVKSSDENKEGDQQNKGRQFKKKLGKNSRKQRILKKQGFDLKQLGNEGEANYELNSSVGGSDDSFSEDGRKKKGSKKVKKDKKEKKQKLTNQQFLDKVKQIGCEDQIDQNESARYNYDSGIEELSRLKPKKQSKNTIKVQNKLFENLEMQIQHQMNSQENNQEEIPQQKLQLQFITKPSSSRAGSFLNKVEVLKKHRGLEADINQAEFQMMAKERAKRSISQLMSKIQNEIEDNEQIDIEIKAPTIAKGKSADLINNTMFIMKSMNQKPNRNSSQNLQTSESGNLINLQNNTSNKIIDLKTTDQQLSKETSNNFGISNKKKSVSRYQFFRQIKESISVRRSKYFSDEELRNSLKPSKLQELQDIRKKLEQKRRKDAMYELGQVEDDDAENVINQLEEELARNGRISKDELRNLLRAEEGLDQLGQYEEQKQKRKKKKQQEESRLKEANQKAIENSQINQWKLQIGNLIESNEMNRQISISAVQLVNQNVSNHENDQNNLNHADDMIEQIDGQGESNNKMDIEADQENNADQIDQEQDSAENQEQGQSEEQQKQQSVSKNYNIQVQDSKDQIENQKLRRELQEEGITLPGANNRKKNIVEGQQINLHKYLVQPNQNSQYDILNAPDIAKQQTSKQTSISREQTLEYKQFKKLRKIAVVIQEKRKKREEQLKRAKQFFQQQAELGSDNQENDDNVKAINKKDDSEEEDGEDLDQELQELIDNFVDINEANEQEAFKKYMQDVKQKDRQQLQRILRGDFRRHNQDMPEMNQMQEDEKNRIERMQKMVDWMKKRQDDEKGLYAKDDSEEDDEMNYYFDYNGNKKKIENKKRKDYQEEIDNEETPQENDEQVQKKLHFYLMDTISPAKRDIDINIHTDRFMELPNMFKKSTRSLIAPFGKKKDQTFENKNQSQKQGQKQSSSIFNFAGNLFNLGNKGDKSTLLIPKTKKTTSHMSEQLNKNQSQKSISANISLNKLNTIFGRALNKKK